MGIAVAAYSLFELAGVSGSLGSLIAGLILSGHPLATRMFDALVSVRELLLVAFFIQIGLGGLPDAGGFLIAGILVAFLVVKAWLFIVILQRCGMSARTSALTGLTLANYSEFGLLITSVAVANGVLPASWLPIMAIAVAGSFVAGSLVSSQEESILRFTRHWIKPRPEHKLAPDERKVKITAADAVVLGMGRVGVGAYRRLRDEYGMNVYGVEFDEDRIESLRSEGFNIIAGDATDTELWRRVEFVENPQLYVVALPSRRCTIDVVEGIRRRQRDEVTIAGTTLNEKSRENLVRRGATVAINVYAGAGEEIANKAFRANTAKRDATP